MKVIAVTGSSGKTTTKEMLFSILSLKRKTVASKENIDPVYNIPSTILKCTPFTKYLVLEMGIEYPGEMDFYLWMTKVDYALITSIFPTHTEFFKSVRGVYEEKIKLAKSLSSEGVVFLNKANRFLKEAEKDLQKNIIFYSADSHIQAERIKIKKDLSIEFILRIGKSKAIVHLPSAGYPNVENSLAAAVVSYHLGFNMEDIKTGLEKYKPLDHRMKILRIKYSLVVDDSYNSNPEALKKAVDYLLDAAGQRKIVMVLGDMLELGSLSVQFHREMGKFLSGLPLAFLLGVGPLSKNIVLEAKKGLKIGRTDWVEKEEEVDEKIKPFLAENSIILLKGSRSVGLDRVLTRLSK